MATVTFRFPSLSLSRSPSSTTTTTTTHLSYSHSTTHLSYFPSFTTTTTTTTHLSYSRSIFPLYSSSFSSGRTIPVRCKSFASHEPDGDDESGNETLEMYRAFLERIFENSSEDELEACIEKLVRPVTVFIVKVKHEENLRMLRVVDPIAADRLEKHLEEQVERLIARARKFLTEYLEKKEDEKKKDEEGPGHEDE